MGAGEQRARRLIFGTVAELYDRARPSYPPELIDDLVGLAGAGAHALDAGCGTGKATVLLAERGLHGVGVDPDAGMARVAARNLARYPSWRVDVSDFEDWEPRADDGSFDLITVAAAWHWIDHERGARRAEQLLRPGGWLAILGYDHDAEHEDPDLRRAIDAVYDDLAPDPDHPSFEPSEPVPAGFAFAPPVLREYRGLRDYTARELVDVTRTQSDNLILPPDRRALLLEKLAAAIDEHGGVYREHFVYRLAAVARR